MILVQSNDSSQARRIEWQWILLLASLDITGHYFDYHFYSLLMSCDSQTCIYFSVVHVHKLMHNHLSWSHESCFSPSRKQFLGLNRNESITCRLNVATAGSARSRLQCRPSTHNLNGLRAWPSASRTDCLHISKSRRNHHRKHITKVTGRIALM